MSAARRPTRRRFCQVVAGFTVVPLTFRSTPLAVAAAIDDAQARDPYPLAFCVVCGNGIDAGALLIPGDRDLRVCTPECARDFVRDFDQWLGEVDQRIIADQTPFYPIDTCVVCSASLADGAKNVVVRNRLFRVCSGKCGKKLDRTPAPYFDALNKAVIKKQKGSYPLANCVVSGQPLGPKAIDYVVANQLIRLADSAQKSKFDDNAGNYLEKLRKAAKAAQG